MNLTLVGMGMGAVAGLTGEAREALSRADAVVGAGRLLDALPGEIAAEKIAAAIPEKVADIVQSLRGKTNVCVALSGDTGFYSGAKKLTALLEPFNPVVLPGIAAPQYLAAKLRRPWQDMHLVSAHGVSCDVPAEALNHRSVFFLTGGDFPVSRIVSELCDAGLCEARVTVGENLSKPDERIINGTAGDLVGRNFAPLSVVLIDNDKTFKRDIASPGIPDGEFQRGSAPMTKREVRVQALSLLELQRDSVVYDVGAGTGSVAVEAALLARRGRVYAIESEAEALDLVRANRDRFGTYNVLPVAGRAPAAFAALPPPDAAFIGGSRGSMREILAALIERNPRVRLVVSAATMETISAAFDALRDLSVANLNAVQITAARTVTRGRYHMLEGGNPIFLISGGGHGEPE